MLTDLFLSWAMIFSLGYIVSLTILKKASAALRLSASLGLGTGAVSFVMAVLGLVYNFQAASVLAVYSVSMSILLWMNRSSVKKAAAKLKRLFSPGASFTPPILSRYAWLAALVAILFFAAALFHIYAFPDLYRDAPLYAQWAKMVFDDKKIELVEGGPTAGLGLASNYPSAFQTLSAFVFTFAGEGLLQMRLTSLLFALMTLVLVAGWSSHLFKRKEPVLLAVLVFTSLPFMILFSRSSSQYMYYLFQFSLGGYFLWGFLTHGDKNNLYLAAMFGGFVLSTSYLGLSFLPVFLLALMSGKNGTEFWRTFTLSVLIMGLVASPWYLRNLVVLGSPLWPYGGTKYIEPAVEANTMGQLMNMSKASGFSYASVGDTESSVGRLLFSYVDPANASQYQGLNPWFLVLALPAAAFIFLRWKQNKDMQFFAVWLVVAIAFFAVTSSFWNRYLMAASLPVAMLSVFVLQRIFDKTSAGSGPAGKTIRYIALFSIVAVWVFSIYLTAFWDECLGGNVAELLPFLGNHEKMLEVCYGDSYRLWTWANENLPRDSLVATTDSLDLYYYKMPTIETNSYWLNGLMTSKNVSESVAVLQAKGVDYVAATAGASDLDENPQFFKKLVGFGNTGLYQVG